MIHEFSALVNIPAADLLGRSRKKEIALGRAVYWWLLYGAGYSYSEIGRLNGRSHCAVRSAVKMVKSALSVGDKKLMGIVENVKYLKYKYMSQINRTVHISAPETTSDPLNEVFVFEGIKCEYCNARGGFTSDERCFNYDPAQGNVFTPCPVCKGTKRVKATVTVVWEPEE